MRIKFSLETIICIAFIIFGLAGYLTIGWGEGTASPFLLRQERAMGALDYQSFPKLCAIALIICCVINIAFQFTKKYQAQLAKAAASAVTENAHKAFVIRFRTIATMVLVAAYALTLSHVPFLYVTAVFLFLMFWVYGQRNLKRTIPISLIGAFCLWGLFIKLASLPLGKI